MPQVYLDRLSDEDGELFVVTATSAPHRNTDYLVNMSDAEVQRYDAALAEWLAVQAILEQREAELYATFAREDSR